MSFSQGFVKIIYFGLNICMSFSQNMKKTIKFGLNCLCVSNVCCIFATDF